MKRVAMVPALGFAVLCVYLGYWQVLRAPALRADPHNSRAQDRLRQIQPGCIRDIDGDVVLDYERGRDGWEATYPAGEWACHLTGYNRRSGLQSSLDEALLGAGRYEKPWEEFVEGPRRGNDVSLTIDLDAQRLGARLLRGRRGAVVAVGAHSGAVLALVSSPTYDPSEVLESDWDFRLFQEDPNLPELNRAVQGVYPPGSVLKILTAAVVLDLGRVTRDTQFECTGRYEIDGAEIHCPRAHGTVTLDQALQVSCNTTFARLATYFTAGELREYAARFGLLAPSGLPLPSKEGSLGDLTQSSDVLLAETAFGQGEALVTPMGVARMTLAVATGGEALAPYLVSSVTDPSGCVVAGARRESTGRAISAQTAQTLAGMMVNVVEKGTGGVAQLSGVEVAGKTGSAENPHGDAHSWFSCFAPATAPEVVVTVIVENAGAGSEAAAPIAREMLEHLLGRAGIR